MCLVLEEHHVSPEVGKTMNHTNETSIEFLKTRQANLFNLFYKNRAPFSFELLFNVLLHVFLYLYVCTPTYIFLCI